MSTRSDISGQVLIVTLDRPEVRNALSTQMVLLAQTAEKVH
jgi:enoyl-CoA hydratase/carnithine racemase